MNVAASPLWRQEEHHQRPSAGQITTQLPLTISGSPSSDTLTGRLGDGRCPLTVENSNGSIELLKGK